MSTEPNTEINESATDGEKPVDEVHLPIIAIESDATPAPPADAIEAETLPVPKAASIDLTVPILDVLTDPTM